MKYRKEVVFGVMLIFSFPVSFLCNAIGHYNSATYNGGSKFNMDGYCNVNLMIFNVKQLVPKLVFWIASMIITIGMLQ